MNVILVGPPGAGKGTQAKVLEAEPGSNISPVANCFGSAMREETELGLIARTYVDRGELVPDDVVIHMILERIFQPDCDAGVIFDGFPTTKEQADALEQPWKSTRRDRRRDLPDAPRDVSAQAHRRARRPAATARRPYNIYYSPPREEGYLRSLWRRVCTRRSDDNWATRKHRLDVYLSRPCR